MDKLVKKEDGALKEFGENCLAVHLSPNADLRESLERAYTRRLRDYEREFFSLTIGPEFSPFVQKKEDSSMDLIPLIRELQRQVNNLAKIHATRAA